MNPVSECGMAAGRSVACEERVEQSVQQTRAAVVGAKRLGLGRECWRTEGITRRSADHPGVIEKNEAQAQTSLAGYLERGVHVFEDAVGQSDCAPVCVPPHPTSSVGEHEPANDIN